MGLLRLLDPTLLAREKVGYWVTCDWSDANRASLDDLSLSCPLSHSSSFLLILPTSLVCTKSLPYGGTDPVGKAQHPNTSLQCSPSESILTVLGF